ncbi:Eco57I restriction-modification methylase domain-containing protein [Dolichospermum sp. UHCC 0315A]|uniref:type IIG restriction enzyme/methyltransferase n=1 Tax=Dolichospermum sp. UHCC 0315A TaxID=1914871 RepID=UPI001FF036C6|nr:TaqI-like C-terminal specificity domain-containing protein [Dolichospermum sp. UHCC 0315A]
MLKVDNLNTKAFQELVLYFLRERLIEKNIEVKYLIVTNIYEWFIFDANSFDKAFIENKTLVKQFTDFAEGRLTSKKTDFFYKEIAQPAIAEIQDQIPFTYFDIRECQEYLQPGENPHDHKLIPLFKLFSPSHLLKLPFSNDSNTLDKGFYSELLHIIGLTETKEGGKKLIQRKKENERNPGSLIENAIVQLDSLDKISRIEKPERFGETSQEQIFNVGLELAITWVNRILFLKLLEAQLIKYHKNDPSFGFLNLEKVQNYHDLNSLFFNVLARKQNERNETVKKIFSHVPYLNSSLFEPTDMEQFTIFINNLRNEKLEIFPATVLKDNNGKKRIGEINALEYLFEFLNAYDFSSESGEEIQEENKRLINASVLGLIFEKINGYKDGSFFTPGFITMYMCRETIRRAVVQKFNEVKGWNCENIDDLYEKIEDKKDANRIINSLKICDPAVGSGHFLVSALNEIIAIKSELKILLDREGKRLKEYDIEVVNDELIVIDDEKLLFEYNPKSKESQRVQETLFHEKQTIIENCLFGVDINPNSVKICRLRLWIELLKNAYYKTSPLTPLLGGEGNIGELETLPNIDINIKCGNSLISRFSLDADLRQALNRNKCSIETYRNAVQTYRNAENKEQKREMERLINDIKGNFKTTLQGSDPNKTKLRKLEGELFNLENQILLFEETKAEKKTREKKISKLNNEIDKLRVEIEDIEGGKIYENALEWRFEFPEVLNNEGVFVGFDVVIGNPPYGVFPSKSELALVMNKYGCLGINNSLKDSYFIFCLLGLKDILKPHGNLCYIIPNTWKLIDAAQQFRQSLIREFRFLCIDQFKTKIFDEATVDCDIILMQNSKIAEYDVKIQLRNRNIIEFVNILSKNTLSKQQFFNFLLDENQLFLSDKIYSKSLLIKDYFDIRNGVKPYEVGKGYPPQTKKILDEKPYTAETKLNETFQPLIGGRYFHKYVILWDDNFWISYGKWLAAPREESIFKAKEKLIFRQTSDQIIGTFIESGFILRNNVHIVLKKDDTFNLKYLLSILNSKLIDFVYTSINPEKGEALAEVKAFHLGMLPFYPLSTKDQVPFIHIVDKILTAKKSDPKADTTALETEIDQLVYQLYELTAEEIKIIEG